MVLPRYHTAGFTLSFLFHGAIVASLLVGQTGMRNTTVSSSTTPLSLAMFQAMHAPAANDIPVENTDITEAAEPVTKPEPKVMPSPVPQPEVKPVRKIEQPLVDVKKEKLREEKTARQEQVEKPKQQPHADKAPPREASEHEQSVENENTLSSLPSSPASSTDSQPSLDHGIIESLEAEYMAALRSAIEAKKYYPKRARRLKREGDVIVDFIIHRDGNIEAIDVLHSSGTELLDRAAIDAIKRLGQFRPIPPEIPRDSWKLKIPIRYALL